jgi:hypothetical protein
MTFATRIILIVTLMFPIAGGVSAQQTTPVATNAETSTVTETTGPAPVSEALSSYEIRNQFNSRIRQNPPELAMILALDPSLLSNQAFLAEYPELARFVADHPEVRRNPRFYLAEFEIPGSGDGVLSDSFEALAIFATFALIAFALAWFVRTVIEQKRWTRLSRTQSEVHNKILDRFGTNEELLEYIRSPAGTKFLESAPIPLRAEQATQNAPLSRILWSIQLGVVVVAGGLGMLLVSGRFKAPTGQDLFAMGVIAISVGAGFIVSAVVSIFLSQRLGLWRGHGAAPINPLEDVRLVK